MPTKWRLCFGTFMLVFIELFMMAGALFRDDVTGRRLKPPLIHPNMSPDYHPFKPLSEQARPLVSPAEAIQPDPQEAPIYPELYPHEVPPESFLPNQPPYNQDGNVQGDQYVNPEDFMASDLQTSSDFQHEVSQARSFSYELPQSPDSQGDQQKPLFQQQGIPEADPYVIPLDFMSSKSEMSPSFPHDTPQTRPYRYEVAQESPRAVQPDYQRPPYHPHDNTESDFYVNPPEFPKTDYQNPPYHSLSDPYASPQEFIPPHSQNPPYNSHETMKSNSYGSPPELMPTDHQNPSYQSGPRASPSEFIPLDTDDLPYHSHETQNSGSYATPPESMPLDSQDLYHSHETLKSGSSDTMPKDSKKLSNYRKEVYPHKKSRTRSHRNPLGFIKKDLNRYAEKRYPYEAPQTRRYASPPDFMQADSLKPYVYPKPLSPYESSVSRSYENPPDFMQPDILTPYNSPEQYRPYASPPELTRPDPLKPYDYPEPLFPYETSQARSYANPQERSYANLQERSYASPPEPFRPAPLQSYDFPDNPYHFEAPYPRAYVSKPKFMQSDPLKPYNDPSPLFPYETPQYGPFNNPSQSFEADRQNPYDYPVPYFPPYNYPYQKPYDALRHPYDVPFIPYPPYFHDLPYPYGIPVPPFNYIFPEYYPYTDVPTIHPPEPPITTTPNFFVNRFQPYSETDVGCEWRVTFKAVQGNGRDVHADFTTPGDINVHVHGAKLLDSFLTYRDGAILDRWDHMVIAQVKVELYTLGIRSTWFVFNGLGASLDNWMSQDRLIASPYKDLKGGSFNYFGVDGHSSEERRFFINRTYGTCTQDCGYLAIVDPHSPLVCSWEQAGSTPLFAYGALPDQCGRYQLEGEGGFADRLVISLKICDNDVLTE